MRHSVVLLGALLFTGPLFSEYRPAADPRIEDGKILWFELTETKADVAKMLGQPRAAGDFANDFSSWQYQIDNLDHDDFSHQLVFRKSTGRLISVTRNYDPERNVDLFFPESETKTYYFPNEKKPEFSIRVRRLGNGRLIMAMGTSKPGQVTGQILLIQQSELPPVYPWLYDQLKEK